MKTEKLKEDIQKLSEGRFPDDKAAYGKLIGDLCRDEEGQRYLFEKARACAISSYGNKIYIRGLIEISNICKNNCYYCGIRKDNRKVSRYRLSPEIILECCRYGYEKGFRTFVLQGGEDPGLTYCGIRKDNRKVSRYRLSPEIILECCRYGYEKGFRTFVLQGGEDPGLTDDNMVDLISKIHREIPDCAITLSLGEKERDSYQRFFDAGANRYLLRHETADSDHYRKLHPPELSLEHRMQCLETLKEIGYIFSAMKQRTAIITESYIHRNFLWNIECNAWKH